MFQYDCKLNLRMDHTSKEYRLNNSNNLNNLNNLNLILQAEIGKSIESKIKHISLRRSLLKSIETENKNKNLDKQTLPKKVL